MRNRYNERINCIFIVDKRTMMFMKQPSAEYLRLRNIFRPYLNSELILKGIPIYEIPSLKSGAPKEAQEAFEKWKVLMKKELEEEAKNGIIF